jgi:hypothetical protein
VKALFLPEAYKFLQVSNGVLLLQLFTCTEKTV